MFLNEISESFAAELQNTYGSGAGVDHLSKIETIDSQYAFIKFGKLSDWADQLNRKTNQQKVERVQRREREAEHRKAELRTHGCEQDYE